MVDLITCKVCGAQKSPLNFYINGKNLRPECKACTIAGEKQRHAEKSLRIAAEHAKRLSMAEITARVNGPWRPQPRKRRE